MCQDRFIRALKRVRLLVYPRKEILRVPSRQVPNPSPAEPASSASPSPPAPLRPRRPRRPSPAPRGRGRGPADPTPLTLSSTASWKRWDAPTSPRGCGSSPAERKEPKGRKWETQELGCSGKAKRTKDPGSVSCFPRRRPEKGPDVRSAETYLDAARPRPFLVVGPRRDQARVSGRTRTRKGPGAATHQSLPSLSLRPVQGLRRFSRRNRAPCYSGAQRKTVAAGRSSRGLRARLDGARRWTERASPEALGCEGVSSFGSSLRSGEQTEILNFPLSSKLRDRRGTGSIEVLHELIHCISKRRIKLTQQKLSSPRPKTYNLQVPA